MYDYARKLVQEDIPEGQFKGVPFLLKDLLAAFEGVPMAMGSRACKNYIPKEDSELVKRFKAAGINENQILIREVKSTISIGKTIVDEAVKGKFGIVVVGRKGLNESFFMGSVSRYVANKAVNCAVWLVP